MRTEQEIRAEILRIAKETTDNIHNAAKYGGGLAGVAAVMLSGSKDGEIRALRWVLGEAQPL